MSDPLIQLRDALRAFAAEVTGAIRLEPLRQEVEQMLLARLQLAEGVEAMR